MSYISLFLTQWAIQQQLYYNSSSLLTWNQKVILGLVAQPSVHYCTTPAQVPVESTEGASVPMRKKILVQKKKKERKKSKKEEVHVAATAFLTIGPAARSGTIACPPIEGDGPISIADIICSIIFRNKQKRCEKEQNNSLKLSLHSLGSR